MVDIGGGTTDIAIFKDGIIRHTAVIPFGGNVITNDIKEGCTILEKQAELLKIKFGSALSSQNKENEIVSIPGLRGRDPKEISLKMLASIIQARMEEIIELVVHEIRNSGYQNKLIGGIVLTVVVHNSNIFLSWWNSILPCRVELDIQTSIWHLHLL